jgi:hypothetical protein
MKKTSPRRKLKQSDVIKRDIGAIFYRVRFKAETYLGKQRGNHQKRQERTLRKQREESVATVKDGPL